MNNKKDYWVCVRCVMDTTDPDIIFDENGICNHCHEFEQAKGLHNLSPAEAKQKLDEMVAMIKKAGQNKRYDCITGVSGGVDSTYTVYLLKQLGLRPLVVHLDNGWNSELAVQNIENIITKLGFDLYTRVLNWNEFKELQLAYLKASVLDLEALTDHAISATLFEQANKYGIKYIMAGTNRVTEAILPLNWRYANKTNDAVNIKAINKQFRKKPIKDFPLLSFQKHTYYWKVKKIQWVSPLDYVNYDKATAKKIIEAELGWRDYGGKHYESVWTRFFQGYYLPKKFGYDKRRAHYSSMICSGLLTRDQALNMMDEPIYPTELLKSDMSFVVKKFGLTINEFNHLLEEPPKKATEYPSNYFLFHKMMKYKNIFRKIATTP